MTDCFTNAGAKIMLSAVIYTAALLVLALLQGHGLASDVPTPKRNRIFGVWYQGLNLSAASYQYVSGGQAEVQWADLHPAPDRFDFSQLDAAVQVALTNIPRSRDPVVTVQVNGNRHPSWLFDVVPYTNHTGPWSHENSDPQGVLSFWHPTFLKAYLAFIDAYAQVRPLDCPIVCQRS